MKFAHRNRELKNVKHDSNMTISRAMSLLQYKNAMWKTLLLTPFKSVDWNCSSAESRSNLFCWFSRCVAIVSMAIGPHMNSLNWTNIIKHQQQFWVVRCMWLVRAKWMSWFIVLLDHIQWISHPSKIIISMCSLWAFAAAQSLKLVLRFYDSSNQTTKLILSLLNECVLNAS